jgi:membrane dipeptidase
MCLICSWHELRSSIDERSSDLAALAISQTHVPRAIELTEKERAAGNEFLRRWPTVDIHSHPGRFFMEGAPVTPFAASLAPPFTDEAVEQIRCGGVGTVVFAAVSDHLLLEASRDGLQAIREFAPGEAYRDYRRQMARLQQLIATGTLRLVRDSSEILEARRLGQPACMFSIEGGDFIEDRLERLNEAYHEGIRSITIIHYHVNQIGDTQTETAVHGGLTALGRRIVEEMNRLGILIDLSHASLAASRQAAEISSQPMLFSHSNLRKSGSAHPRLISVEHARLVTDRGGLVGATSAGFDQSTFEEYIVTILRMVDAVGIDHVAIGTDLDFTFKPVFSDYRDWSLVPAALLAHGMHDAEVAKILGGNFLRLLDAARDGSVARQTAGACGKATRDGSKLNGI